MKIKAESLSRALSKEQHPLYWITGDEPLLVQEAADTVRKSCRKHGFEEREIFYGDRSFSWEQFSQSMGNLSLFAARRIIELRLESPKLDDTGKKVLGAYLEAPSPDHVVLITSPRIEGSVFNTKWFKAIEQHSGIVQIWPLNRSSLGPWLEQRLAREGIQPDAEALSLLIDRIEGNLLAAMQEIEKLKLLAGVEPGAKVKLDAKTVMQAVADNSRFNAFQMIDAALAGDAARAQRILRGLQAEGIFPLPILGAITRELRILLPMIERRNDGHPISGIIQAGRVIFHRKKVVGAALERLQTGEIWRMLEHARLIDQSIKGMNNAATWDELSLMLLRLSGTRTATMG